MRSLPRRTLATFVALVIFSKPKVNGTNTLPEDVNRDAKQVFRYGAE